jgi:transposase InsO family protein
MIGPLPTTPGGFNRVLVAIDKFTKWIEVKPVTCPKADRVLDFLDELVHRYGLPHRIITDLGSNFNNHQFWEYCENNGIDVRYVSVAHPRANGQVERANGMVLDALKKRLHDAANTKGVKWIKELPNAFWGASHTTHQADGTVTLFPSLLLRSYPTCRRLVGFAGSRVVRRRHLRRQQTS